MPPTARTISRRTAVWVGLGLGVLGALLGIGVGHFLGGAFGRGFRVDWYQFRPAPTFDAYQLGLYAAACAALVALVMVLLGSSLGFKMAARPKTGDVIRGVRTKGQHTLRLLLAYGIVVPALIGVAIMLFLAATGLATGVDGADLQILAAGGALLAGFVATYFAFVRTHADVERGRLILGDQTENLFAKIALFCGGNAKATLIILLLITAGLGYGLVKLDTNVDVADVLPRGDPNTAAAKNLTSKFKSSFTLQVTFQLHVTDNQSYAAEAAKKLPYRRTEARPQNISDELYVRAVDELLEFAKNYRSPKGEESPFVASVALPDFYRIINWTLAGGKNASNAEQAFGLPTAKTPEGSLAYAAVDRGVWQAIPATADAVISPTGRQTAALITVSSQETLSGKEIGRWALEIRDAYLAWAKERPEERYQVFTGANAPKFSVDLPIANAHSSELAGYDFQRLLPVIGAWILATIFIAFRNASSIIIAFSALVMGVTWTFGLMGYMEIPLNTLNLTVIPLIMGVGIDYGIHTLNEYQGSRASGRSPEDTFRHLGGHAFFALFVATLNTVTGLAVMIISPSLLIAQLGILTVIAISSSYLITITFIPAALRLNPSARVPEYRPSPFMGSLAKTVSRYRYVAIAIIVLITAVMLPATQLVPIEAFGDPPRNWLDKDPLRQEHDAAIKGFYDIPPDGIDDVKANILIFEGNINDPAAHRYMDRIETVLRTYRQGGGLPANPITDRSHECSGDARGGQGRVIADTLRTLPFFVRTYLTVKDGVRSVAEYTLLERLAQNQNFRGQSPYPSTEAGVSALLNEVQTTPLRGLGQLFYDHPDDQMAMMLFSVKAASFEDAREVWCQVQAVLADPSVEGVRPRDLHVSFFGNTAINYLFVAKELPWVGYMSVVSNILVLAFVYLPTRLFRLTLLVGVLNLLAGVWWFAMLPQFGVGQAITLTLPLVYIYAIGSDYGMHLALTAISLNDTEEAFRTTGKGVLFSGITTFGAFLIYTQMSNLAVQRTMIATAAAIPIIFLVTVLVVPVIYPVGKRFRKEHGQLEQAEHIRLAHEPIDKPIPETVLFEGGLAPAPPPTEPLERRRVQAVAVRPLTAVVRAKPARPTKGPRKRRTRKGP